VGIIAFSYFLMIYLLCAARLRSWIPPWRRRREHAARSAPDLLAGGDAAAAPALYGGPLLVALDALIEFDAFVALKYQTFSLSIYAQYQVTSVPRERSPCSNSSRSFTAFGRARGRANEPSPLTPVRLVPECF
jgi:hypothetical protein